MRSVFGNSSDELSNITRLDWKVRWLLIAAFLLIIGSFIAPFLFTRKAINQDFSFLQTGQIGDTIGGIMNPFIAIAGIVVTGLAFYIQYKANLLQRALFLQEQADAKTDLQFQIDRQNEQIKRQQSESQFYEMLRLHRDNVSEMEISGYDFEEGDAGLKYFEKKTKSRKVFVVMKTEFECILNAYLKHKTLDKNGFEKCYRLFFFGLDSYEKQFPNESTFISELRTARNKHRFPKQQAIESNRKRKAFLPDRDLNFNYKPFSGHSQLLGHYFRHLYLAVKSIVYSDVITEYTEKMKYLKILRAQLSNHEQIMLFYNWLGGFGDDWENESNTFFTRYRMINNLWYEDLFSQPVVSNAISDLKVKHANFEKEPMFEIDE